MSTSERRSGRPQASYITVTRRYAPDLARQAQALLRLLGARSINLPGDTAGGVDQMPKEDIPQAQEKGH